MITLPLTLQAWFELFIIGGMVYWFVLYYSYYYGMRLVLLALGYFIFCFGICIASCSLIMPLLSYITLLCAIIIVLHSQRSAQTIIQPARLTTNAQRDNSSWLASCLKTIFNHPTNTQPITLLLEIQTISENALYNKTPLNLAWNPGLFTSILYDPQLGTTMIWLSSNGLLKGLSVQWTEEKDFTEELQKIHIQQTSEYDAVVCSVDPLSRSCTLIYKGIISGPKNLIETIQYITILTHQSHAQNKEKYYGNFSQKQDQNSVNHTT